MSNELLILAEEIENWSAADMFPDDISELDRWAKTILEASRRLRPEVTDEARRQIEWAVQKLTDQYGENGDEAAAIIRAFVLEGSQK